MCENLRFQKVEEEEEEDYVDKSKNQLDSTLKTLGPRFQVVDRFSSLSGNVVVFLSFSFLAVCAGGWFSWLLVSWFIFRSVFFAAAAEEEVKQNLIKEQKLILTMSTNFRLELIEPSAREFFF